jgi:DNA-binding response OmpR family regulator
MPTASAVSQRKCVLIIGGDAQRASRLRHILAQYGYEAVVSPTLDGAITGLGEGAAVGLVWLGDNIAAQEFSPLRTGRLLWPGAPILCATNSASEEERCRMLAAGAHVVLTQESGMSEIGATFRALISMLSEATTEELFNGCYSVDHRTRVLTRLDVTPARDVVLPLMQHALFCALAGSAGKTVPYAIIDRRVWKRLMTGCEPTRRKLVGRLEASLDCVGGLRLLVDARAGLRMELEK